MPGEQELKLGDVETSRPDMNRPRPKPRPAAPAERTERLWAGNSVDSDAHAALK